MTAGFDEYIAALPGDQQVVLATVRRVVHQAVPLAQERMSYQMPGFWQGDMLLWFAATRRHLGVYPTAAGVLAFADRLVGYDTSKGAIRIPWVQPIPYELIAEIAAFRLRQVEAKQQAAGDGMLAGPSATVVRESGRLVIDGGIVVTDDTIYALLDGGRR